MSYVKVSLKSKTGLKVLSEIKKLCTLTINTLNGKYGNGEDRKAALGSYYDRVQTIINYLYKEGLL